ILWLLHGIGFPDWAYWHTLVYLTTLLAVSLLSVLAALAIYSILRDVIGKKYMPAMAVVAVWLGTLAFPYSTLFFSHQLAAALLALAFYLLWRLKRDQSPAFSRQIICAAGAGLLMSFSVASEYPTVLLAAILFGYAAWIMWQRSGSARIAGILAG